MTLFVIIGAVFGSLFTWLATKYFHEKKRRRDLRDTTAQMQRSMAIQDHHYATQAMLYLSALRALESGDSESAKRDLASGAAAFYYQFGGSEQSQWIQTQRREVELLSNSSPVLRETLEKRKRELEQEKHCPTA